MFSFHETPVVVVEEVEIVDIAYCRLLFGQLFPSHRAFSRRPYWRYDCPFGNNNFIYKYIFFFNAPYLKHGRCENPLYNDFQILRFAEVINKWIFYKQRKLPSKELLKCEQYLFKSKKCLQFACGRLKVVVSLLEIILNHLKRLPLPILLRLLQLAFFSKLNPLGLKATNGITETCWLGDKFYLPSSRLLPVPFWIVDRARESKTPARARLERGEINEKRRLRLFTLLFSFSARLFRAPSRLSRKGLLAV